MLLSRKSGCKITTFPSIHKIFSIFFVFLHPDMAQFTDNELSILIPTYNCVCVELVRQLHRQAMAIGIKFQIIVADDGSTDTSSIETNRAIARLPHCLFIERTENSGRAAIRNFLARKATYAYLLYIDSDMTVISDDFISRYIACLPAQVVDGGVAIIADSDEQKQLLRYRYEKAEEPHHTASERQKTPYQHLHTANLLIAREQMLQHPFDERLRHYGYEDVLWDSASSRAMPTLWLRPRRACAPYTSSAATCAAIPACSHWYRAYTSQPSCGSCAFGTECLEQ